MAHTTVRLLGVALLASTALVACKKNDDSAVTTDTAPATAPVTAPDASLPPPAPMPSATPSAAAVSDLQLGTSVGADGRVGSPMTSFGAKDTLYASVTTAPNSSGTLAARWLYLGADGAAAAPTEVDTQSKTLAGGGPTTHEFHVSKPDGWPLGKYRVEITHDGSVVQTRDFDVR